MQKQTAMTIRFDRDLADRAKVVAAVEHRTLTSTIIVAIEEYVAKLETARGITKLLADRAEHARREQERNDHWDTKSQAS
jgi:predicted transcriptional regulator